MPHYISFVIPLILPEIELLCTSGVNFEVNNINFDFPDFVTDFRYDRAKRKTDSFI